MINEFLNEYKALETALRDNPEQPDTVFDLENTSNFSDKLKLCRMIRNYAQHNEDYQRFLRWDSMTAFLEQIRREIEKKEETVRDITRRYTVLTLNNTVEELLLGLSKTKFPFVIITDVKGEYLGVVDASFLVSLLASGVKTKGKLKGVFGDLKDLKKNSRDVKVVSPEEPVMNFLPGEWLVVVRSGKVIGGAVVN